MRCRKLERPNARRENCTRIDGLSAAPPPLDRQPRAQVQQKHRLRQPGKSGGQLQSPDFQRCLQRQSAWSQRDRDSASSLSGARSIIALTTGFPRTSPPRGGGGRGRFAVQLDRLDLHAGEARGDQELPDLGHVVKAEWNRVERRRIDGKEFGTHDHDCRNSDFPSTLRTISSSRTSTTS